MVSTLSADSCCATKVLYVSMSVSVQCLCADVEGNDVPTNLVYTSVDGCAVSFVSKKCWCQGEVNNCQ